MGGAPSIILSRPPLMLGGKEVLADVSFFADNGISAVVSVCDHLPPACVQSRLALVVQHFNVPDEPNAPLGEHFLAIVAFIHTARVSGKGVYVHCTAGISRSTAAMAAYLMAALDIDDAQALGHIQRCRDTACPNDGFRQQLTHFNSVRKETMSRVLQMAERACDKDQTPLNAMPQFDAQVAQVRLRQASSCVLSPCSHTMSPHVPSVRLIVCALACQHALAYRCSCLPT